MLQSWGEEKRAATMQMIRARPAEIKSLHAHRDLYISVSFFLCNQKGGRSMAKIKEQESEYTQFISCVEDMPAIAADIVSKYCEINNIDESDIYPSIWNDIITELYIKLFRPCNRLLKKDNAQYNDYDIDRVVYIYHNIYKRLCNKHCQEISQKGFCDMSGINKQTLYDWMNGRLSSQRSDLQEKIMEDNEESLFSLMKDRRNNPMKILPKLNKVHGWSMPGARERADTKQALTAAELPKLNNNADVPSNCTIEKL